MKARILVVDDEAAIRGSLTRVCKLRDQQVLNAWTLWGTEEAFSLGEVRIAFVDINLSRESPELTGGIDVISWLLSQDHEIFICAMSGRPENEEPAKQVGADHFLDKPFEAQEVLDLLDQVFG